MCIPPSLSAEPTGRAISPGGARVPLQEPVAPGCQKRTPVAHAPLDPSRVHPEDGNDLSARQPLDAIVALAWITIVELQVKGFRERGNRPVLRLTHEDLHTWHGAGIVRLPQRHCNAGLCGDPAHDRAACASPARPHPARPRRCPPPCRRAPGPSRARGPVPPPPGRGGGPSPGAGRSCTVCLPLCLAWPRPQQCP